MLGRGKIVCGEEFVPVSKNGRRMFVCKFEEGPGFCQMGKMTQNRRQDFHEQASKGEKSGEAFALSFYDARSLASHEYVDPSI